MVVGKELFLNLNVFPLWWGAQVLRLGSTFPTQQSHSSWRSLWAVELKEPICCLSQDSTADSLTAASGLWTSNTIDFYREIKFAAGTGNSYLALFLYHSLPSSLSAQDVNAHCWCMPCFEIYCKAVRFISIISGNGHYCNHSRMCWGFHITWWSFQYFQRKLNVVCVKC